MSRQAFALLNLVLIFGAAIVGMWLFFRAHPDTSGVRGSRLLGSGIRAWYLSNLVPFENLFVHLHVRPIWLTYTQLAAGFLSGFAYAVGLVYTAGFLVLFSGTLDILDGRVARRIQGDSPRGAFLDSVVDRYTEFAGYAGLLVFFRSGWEVWAVLAAMLGGVMVSYARARAEGLGVRCDVGLLQRPERFVLLGFGSIFSSLAVHLIGGRHELLALTVALIAVLSNVTAVQRIVHVARALNGSRDG